MTRRDRGRLIPATNPSLWPDPDEGPFRLRFYWDVIDGRVECAGLELTSIRNPEMPMIDGAPYGQPGELIQQPEPEWWSTPRWQPQPTPLTTSVLRQLNLSTLIADAKEALAVSLRARAFHGLLDRADSDSAEYQELADAAEEAPTRRGRKPTYGRAHYARVAEIYARAIVVGIDARNAVAESESVSPTAAAKWIARARELGFLEPTERGKAGGVPPSLLERITAEIEEGDKGES